MFVTSASCLLVGAQAASAVTITQSGGLHFVGTPTVTTTKDATSATLSAIGEVAGAGTTATATLTATAEVTTGCINRGSKDQQPSGLERTFTQVSDTDTFRTRSGRGTFSLSTTVGIDRTCPDQMVPVLVSVVFHDVTVTVTSQTGTTTAFFGDIDP